MDQRTFDRLIQDTLREQAEAVSMSDRLERQIKEAVFEGRKEENLMTRYGKRKIILAAAVLCLLGSMVAVAAGKIVGYSSHTDTSQPHYTTFAELSKASAQTGFPVKAVEELAGGYRFEEGYLVQVEGHDDAGNVVSTFPELMLYYLKDGKRITLSIKAVSDQEEKKTTGNPVDIDYQDRVLTYSVDHYRFVPPDYEVSEEEQQAMDAGELYISYGDKEVEEQHPSFLSWDDGGVHYMLLYMNEQPLEQDAMVEMAKQIIDSTEM